MSSLKGYELEKRDIRNDVVKVLNQSWLPNSTKADIMVSIQQELVPLAEKDLENQEVTYQEAIKKEQEESKEGEK